jgi:hypothetical protein
MQTAQARQRKREEKRLRREEKRRTLRTSLPDWPVFFPRPRISDTLVDYARPLIDRLPPDYAPEELRKALLIASGVWNAVVAGRGDIDLAIGFVAQTLTEEAKEPVPREVFAVIARLAMRKLGRFGDDDRLVTGVEVYRDGEGFRVLVASERPADLFAAGSASRARP